MDCSRINTQITAYLDDFLSAQERRAFEQHLSGCPLCRSEVELSRELNGLIDETDLDFAVPDLSREIMTRINELGVTSAKRDDDSRLRIRGALKFRSVVADLVVSAAAAMMLLWFSGPALNMENVSGYSKEVFRFSGAIGSVFESYVKFSATAVDKLSVSVKSVEQFQLKGDVRH